MGGRGSSFLQPEDIAVSVTGADGTSIDLSGSPLHYGDADPNLLGAVRAAIEAFENKRWANKIEFSCFVDAQGKVIENNRGGKGSVGATLLARSTAEAMTHNHPRSGRESDCLGGTFSTADISNFVRFRQNTYRATAAEGTYSISKLKDFDGPGLNSYYTAENARNRSTYHATANALAASCKAGSITYTEYRTELSKAFNAYLVAEHNSLRAGQKFYGYQYTLERRSK